jgi:hypothetical protein
MSIDNEVQSEILKHHKVKLFNTPAEKGSRGRPSKGSLWIIPKNIKCQFSQISKRISTVQISNII